MQQWFAERRWYCRSCGVRVIMISSKLTLLLGKEQLVSRSLTLQNVEIKGRAKFAEHIWRLSWWSREMEAGPAPEPGAGAGPVLIWWPSCRSCKSACMKKLINVCRKGGLTHITSHIQAQICVRGRTFIILSVWVSAVYWQNYTTQNQFCKRWNFHSFDFIGVKSSQLQI